MKLFTVLVTLAVALGGGQRVPTSRIARPGMPAKPEPRGSRLQSERRVAGAAPAKEGRD
jgi:hypothetical protein